jgi:hypothetical protein
MALRQYASSSAVSSARQADIEDVFRQNLAILSEPFELGVAGSTLILTSGVLYLTAIALLDGDRVDGIASSVSVVGSGQTTVFLGLYDRSGTRLGTSADVKADFASGAVNKVSALVSPALITKSDIYYTAICGVGGTQPTLVRGNTNIGSNDATLPTSYTVPRFAAMAGQTTLPATATFANAGSASFWLGAV